MSARETAGRPLNIGVITDRVLSAVMFFGTVPDGGVVAGPFLKRIKNRQCSSNMSKRETHWRHLCSLSLYGLCSTGFLLKVAYATR